MFTDDRNRYEKIQMTADKSEGGFVRTLEGETGTGFNPGSHVHRDWYKGTLPYDAGFEQLEQAKSEREDICDRRDSMSPDLTDDGNFVFRYKDGRTFTPTVHAMTQMGIRADTSTFYLNSLREEGTDRKDAETLVVAVRNGLRHMKPEKQLRFRTYKNGTMRAYLTDQYAPVDNRWYLEQIKRLIPEGRLSHWRGDADTIYGNVLIPETIMDYENTNNPDDKDYGGMISIGNCEIGTRRISQYPSLFRAICMNGCIWGQIKGKDIIGKKHRGTIDLKVLGKQIEDNIEKQLPLLPQGIQRLLGIKAFGCGDVKPANLIAVVAQDHKLTAKESTEVLTQWVQHEKNDRNLFGITNAITRAGQTMSNARWVQLDNVGGNLLDMDQGRWSTYKTRANMLSEKDLTKIFAEPELV